MTALRLRFGIVRPGADPRTSLVPPSASERALERFTVTLGEALGIAVDVQPFSDYAGLAEAAKQGHIALAWLPPIVAVAPLAEGKFVPVVIPIRNGRTSFGSALFATKASGIRNLIDLNGLTVGWVDKKSAGGYLVIRASLRNRGIDPRVAFGQELFFGSHENVVHAVLDGTVQVGATYVHFDPNGRGIAHAGWGDHEVRVVALADAIPNDLLGVGASVPKATREALRAALVHASGELAVAAKSLFEAEGFAEARPEHRSALAALAAHLDPDAVFDSTLPPPPS
jgi:phosphonate transport system substrate-binding protein